MNTQLLQDVRTARAVIINKLLGVMVGFCMCATASAATVWMPTDGDVNFLFTFGGSLAMFDDEDQTYAGSHLELEANDRVTFTPNGSDFDAENLAMDTLTLTNSRQFILGLSVDGGSSWIADSGYIDFGNNAFRIFFENEGETLAVDVGIVPVPAAVWLFGSGLIGLAGMARRTNKSAMRADIAPPLPCGSVNQG